MGHSTVSAEAAGHRGPSFPLCLTLLYHIVGDGRATIVFREEPVELARVAGQVHSREGDAHGPRNICSQWLFCIIPALNIVSDILLY